MLKRWGSLADNLPTNMDMDMDMDMDDDNRDDDDAQEQGIMGLAGRRAVVDLWEKQEVKEASLN